MKIYLSLNAITLSQYKSVLKQAGNIWDKDRYKDIFQEYTDAPKAYRIYLSILQSKPKKERIPIPIPIKKYVENKGYVIESYIEGIAVTKDGKTKIKIGKLLKEDPSLLNTFNNDSTRSLKKKDDLIVVISRHPYDLTGASTGRGWTSCHDLNGDSNTYLKYLPLNIQHGTLVAYLIRNNDKNINNPISRVLIKPFFNLTTNKIALVMDGTIYGTNSDNFRKTVKSWIDVVNAKYSGIGVYLPHPELYSEYGDDHPNLIIGSLKDILKADEKTVVKCLQATIVTLNSIGLSKAYSILNNFEINGLKEIIEKDRITIFDFCKTNTSFRKELLAKFNSNFLLKLFKIGFIDLNMIEFTKKVEILLNCKENGFIDWIEGNKEPVKSLSTSEWEHLLQYLSNDCILQLAANKTLKFSSLTGKLQKKLKAYAALNSTNMYKMYKALGDIKDIPKSYIDDTFIILLYNDTGINSAYSILKLNPSNKALNTILKGKNADYLQGLPLTDSQVDFIASKYPKLLQHTHLTFDQITSIIKTKPRNTLRILECLDDLSYIQKNEVQKLALTLDKTLYKRLAKEGMESTVHQWYADTFKDMS